MPFISRVKLKAASNAAALQEHTVVSWLDEQQTHLSESSLPSAILVPRQAVGVALKRMALDVGKALFNVHVLTPGQLRTRLSKAGGFEAPIAVREDLRLFMRYAAQQMVAEYPEAQLIADNPDQLLSAWDRYSASGYNASDIEGKLYCEIVQSTENLVKQAGLETVYERDRKLVAKALDYPLFADMLVYGFGAEQMEQINLIHAGLDASVLATMCLCLGKQPKEESVWISEWEKRYGSYKQVEDATVAIPLKSLSEKVAASDKSEKGASYPVVFCGYTHIRQEAKAAVIQTAKILETSPNARVGIVIPLNSVLSREICSELNKQGLPHHDVKGSYEGPDNEQRALLAWAQWQESPTVNHFFEFLNYLKQLDLTSFEVVEKIQRSVDNAFLLLGVDDLNILQFYLFEDLKKHMEAIQLLQEWSLLPERNSLEGFIAQATPVLKRFQLQKRWDDDAEYTLPLQRTLKSNVSRGHFIHWFRERLRKPGRTRQRLGRAVFSNIQVVDYESAAYFTFTHAIFTGLNKDGWPGERQENLFLTHNRIRQLNLPYKNVGEEGSGYISYDKSFIVGAEQQRILAESAWIHLLEQVSESAVFSLTIDPSSESEGMKVAGDFFLKTWLAAKGNLPNEAELDALAEEGKAYVAHMEVESIPPWEDKSHCCQVWENRRNPELPYGAYEYGYETAPQGGLSLSVKDWEDVLTRPVKTWYAKILKAPKAKNYSELQSRSLTDGTRFHNWIELKPSNRFMAVKTSGSWLENLKLNAETYRAEAERYFKTAGRNLPDWWLREWAEVLDKAYSVAQELDSLEDWDEVASEYKIPDGIQVSLEGVDGSLTIRGRSDCVFTMNGRKRIWIVDFKTGKSDLAVKGARLLKGEGLQLYLYGIALMNDFRSPESYLTIIHPGDLLSPKVMLPENLSEEFQLLWKELIKISKSGVVGMKKPMKHPYAEVEDLPIATTLIDGKIIEAKWQLTHLNIPVK
jgi:hypothetical protein